MAQSFVVFLYDIDPGKLKIIGSFRKEEDALEVFNVFIHPLFNQDRDLATGYELYGNILDHETIPEEADVYYTSLVNYYKRDDRERYISLVQELRKNGDEIYRKYNRLIDNLKLRFNLDHWYQRVGFSETPLIEWQGKISFRD